MCHGVYSPSICNFFKNVMHVLNSFFVTFICSLFRFWYIFNHLKLTEVKTVKIVVFTLHCKEIVGN